MTFEARSSVGILLVDDDPQMLETIGEYLIGQGYRVTLTDGGRTALSCLEKNEYDIIITDLSMPGIDGFDIMEEARRLHPDTPVIVLTGRGTLENAVLAIKYGAYDFLTKPLSSLKVLQIHIERALEKRYLLLSRKAYLAQIEEQNRALLQDLEAARRIQEHILRYDYGSAGHCLNITTRYHPAEKVGGDFFDVLHLLPHFVVFYMADVAGHGVSAAMVTVFAKQTLRTISENLASEAPDAGPDPRRILLQFNKEMLKQSFQMDGMPLYLTIFIGVYHAVRHTIRFCNGGHHPLPRHLNHIGRLSLIDCTGNPVGMFDDPSFQEGAIEIKDHERLVLCTDGLVEATNQVFTTFGSDRMDAFLRQSWKMDAEQVADGLIDRVRSHRQGNPQSDDIALLILSPK